MVSYRRCFQFLASVHSIAPHVYTTCDTKMSCDGWVPNTIKKSALHGFPADSEVHGGEYACDAPLSAAHASLLQHPLHLVCTGWRQVELHANTMETRGKGSGDRGWVGGSNTAVRSHRSKSAGEGQSTAILWYEITLRFSVYVIIFSAVTRVIVVQDKAP